MKNHVLIIDSDTMLCHHLTHLLNKEGFDVSCVHDGETGVKKALNLSFDFIILDLALPKLNGFHALKTMREHLDTPVLILSSRSDDIDRILALEQRADDYLQKPCSFYELLARIHAILRRTKKSKPHQPIIQRHHILFDAAKRYVTVHEKALDLTNTEFNILEILIKSPGQAFSKEELTEYALGRKFTAYDRSIDVHISNLRNKLGHTPSGEDWIKTVRGFGYLFHLGTVP